MDILLTLIVTTCAIIPTIDIFLKWRKQLTKKSQIHLPENNSENQSHTIIQPQIKSTEVDDDAKSQISRRLYIILELLNQNRNDNIPISKLAEFCEYKNTSDLEKYFKGLEEPSNKEKEDLCFRLGVNSAWLKHGKGEPFKSQEPYEFYAIDYLETIKKSSPKEIIFVRCRNTEGEAAIILRLNEFKYVYMPKTWNISDNVGTKGQEQIHSFYKLVLALLNLNSKETGYSFLNIHLKGNHIKKQDFDNLICGKVYPASIIKFHNDTWWDDLTDFNHSWACSPSYEGEHGKNFIKAQEIIKYFEK